MYIVYTSKSKHVWLLIAKPILMTHIKQNRTYSELNNYKQKTHFTKKCIFFMTTNNGDFFVKFGKKQSNTFAPVNELSHFFGHNVCQL